MAKREYLRTDSDCCLLQKHNVSKGYGSCEALIDVAFEKYVFNGECGTYKCPFYKRDAQKVRIGEVDC